MTPEQEQRFDKLVLAVEAIDKFWSEPPYEGDPPRAAQLDKILRLSRGTTFAGKALMMLFGIVVTIATAWSAFKALSGID
jgi:hypothetical protein|tara:strand:+ start:645 stop:884 length:240 start_codon:yes stop_codon:yes gene_type:complete